MPLIIVRNDITKMKVDAIVNAANNTLLGGGGVDGAIHNAAGEKLLKKCITLGGCETGKAKITKGYNLPAKHIIHTVGPVWRGGTYGEEKLLESCYESSLYLAANHKCKSVAFPLISSGAYGFPKRIALDIATNTIRKFLEASDITVYIVVYDTESFGIGKELFPEIMQYIDDRHTLSENICSDLCIEPDAFSKRIDLFWDKGFGATESPVLKNTEKDRKTKEKHFRKIKTKKERQDYTIERAAEPCPPIPAALSPAKPSLEDKLKMLDESFSEMLLRKIDESGMTDSECYKKANIDRKLFSKIRSDKNYRPSKPTVLAFAIALRMNIDDTKDFLARAGFAFSPASKFDVIVEYFITNHIYDIFEINNALFSFDQNLLGA